ncbi:Spy0128 family protein [Oribacterium sp. FC2011]|uniref:Spy0128 family protein n=1 Tax=Oribacterium sp. FC2011 TaxID=1408311 RepID=UPI00067933B7|nr:FctA domain-containing protein [Oribacterium sp. FC2011]
MSRVLRKNYIGAFMVMLFALLLNICAFAAEYKADAEVPFSVTMKGEKASSEKMTITITPIDGAPEFDQDSITVDAKKGETVKDKFTMTSSVGSSSPIDESSAYDESAEYMYESDGAYESGATYESGAAGETGGYEEPKGFLEPGDYEYEVRQISGNTDAYVYDDTVYRVIVAVRNNEDYNLEATVVAYKNGDKKAKQDIEFVNVYEPCLTDPPVRKVVVEDEGTAPDDVKFTFSMKADDKTYPMPEGSVDGVKTIETGVGEVEFGNMYYEKVGTYTYSVVEKKGDAASFTYDETQYTIKVVVEKKDGKLEATRTIYSGDKTFDEIVFENHYAKAGEKKNDTTPGTTSGSSTTKDNSKKHESDYVPDPGSGSVLGAVRDAIEDGPVGQVLGAARDLVEDGPIGQVLGAVRGATRTGDNSFMMVSGLCFLAALAVLLGWIKAFLKRSR